MRGLFWALASAEARMVADLFSGDPDGWSYDRSGIQDEQDFDVRHTSGLTVWIANDEYGVAAYRGKHQSSVTNSSVLGLSPDHKVIWHAFRRWERSAPERLSRQRRARGATVGLRAAS